MMHKLIFLATVLVFVAFNSLAQDEIFVATGELRCDTVAKILIDHGALPLFSKYAGADARANKTWRTVNDAIGPLALAYGCPPVDWESHIVPTSVEVRGPEVKNPEAHISFPPPVYVVRHRVAIRGTVNMANMRNFYIEFRPLYLDSETEHGDENAYTWYPATLPRIEPVKDGILGTWHTEFLKDGLYELRLNYYTGSDPRQYVYLSPIRVEKAPYFAAATLEYPASDERAPLSVYDSSDPLVFTSDEYGLSTVLGPLAVPKGFHLVSWKNTSGTGEGGLSVHVYALTPCFAFHETGADEDLLFGYEFRGGEKTEVLKVIEDGCQLLLEVNPGWRLEAWAIEIQRV